MKLLSDELATSLENLMGFCFAGNRIADRCQAQLKVKFVMPNVGNFIHLEFAHKMPLVADSISDYCESRNYDVNYPLTPADYSKYNTTKEVFDKLLEYVIDLEKLTIDTITVAEQEDDKMTIKFLNDFLIGLAPYTKMMLTFVDYIEQNGFTSKDNMDMDSRLNNIVK